MRARGVGVGRFLPLMTVPLLLWIALVSLACRQDDDAMRIEFLRAASQGDATATPTPAATAAATPAPSPAPRVSVSADEVLRGPADRPYLSLVINAGSGFRPAVEILDVLADRRVRATFFLMGWWAERNPDIVQRIAAEGHEIASHGYQVFDLTTVSDAEVIADLERADAVIRGITGRSTRPLWSPSAGYRNARVDAIAARLGYRPILWSQDSADWREEATADLVLRRILAGAEPGAIIVLHLDSPQSGSATAAVLGQAIDAIRARGLEPVTISDLIGE